jgi:hypothetical protein
MGIGMEARMPQHCRTCDINYDEGRYCRRCGSLLVDTATPELHGVDKFFQFMIGHREVSYAKSFLNFLILLALAMIVTSQDPHDIFIFYFFPSGLGAFLTNGKGQGDFWFFVGYLVYWMFLFLFLSARSNKMFQIVRLVFVLVLVMNVKGCWISLNHLSKGL